MAEPLHASIAAGAIAALAVCFLLFGISVFPFLGLVKASQASRSEHLAKL